MTSTMEAIHTELTADEATALADPELRAAAKAALALAEKTAPGTFSPNPSLPSALYFDLIIEAGRVERLRFVVEGGDRPSNSGYFTQEHILNDIARVMRRAMK